MPCHGVQWHDVAWLCLGIDGRTLPWLGMAFSGMVVLFVVTVDRSVAVCSDAGGLFGCCPRSSSLPRRSSVVVGLATVGSQRPPLLSRSGLACRLLAGSLTARRCALG